MSEWVHWSICHHDWDVWVSALECPSPRLGCVSALECQSSWLSCVSALEYLSPWLGCVSALEYLSPWPRYVSECIGVAVPGTELYQWVHGRHQALFQNAGEIFMHCCMKLIHCFMLVEARMLLLHNMHSVFCQFSRVCTNSSRVRLTLPLFYMLYEFCICSLCLSLVYTVHIPLFIVCVNVV